MFSILNQFYCYLIWLRNIFYFVIYDYGALKQRWMENWNSKHSICWNLLNAVESNELSNNVIVDWIEYVKIL